MNKWSLLALIFLTLSLSLTFEYLVMRAAEGGENNLKINKTVKQCRTNFLLIETPSGSNDFFTPPISSGSFLSAYISNRQEEKLKLHT